MRGGVLQSGPTELDIALNLLEISALLLPLLLIASRVLFDNAQEVLDEHGQNVVVRFLGTATITLIGAVGIASIVVAGAVSSLLTAATLLLFVAFGMLALAGVEMLTAYPEDSSEEPETSDRNTRQEDLGAYDTKSGPHEVERE